MFNNSKGIIEIFINHSQRQSIRIKLRQYIFLKILKAQDKVSAFPSIQVYHYAIWEKGKTRFYKLPLHFVGDSVE